MGQRGLIQFVALAFIVSNLPAGGCKGHSQSTDPPATAKSPTIVSLVPAATDILIGMGAQDHLVGVSNFDQNPATAKLPKLGDYMTTDWEKIAGLRPNIIVTQYAPGRTPEGFAQNVRALGITQLNLHIDRLEEIFSAIGRIGAASGEDAKAAAAARQLRDRLDQIRRRVSGLRRVRTLIVTDDAGRQTTGSGTFLDDILVVAGGENVVPPTAPLYPVIDREQLMLLAPQVVLQLLPDASPAVLAQAERAWANVADVPAVKNHRVYTLTDWNVQLPGYHVGELAEKFAELLHPEISSDAGKGVPKAAP